MKTWVRKSLNVGVLSAGFLLISGGAAHADWTTGYNAGLLNGNQFDTTLQLPVNVCGNSIAVLGFADAECDGGATAVNTESATTEDWTTGYNAGAGNGNQTSNTLQAPLNLSGNALGLWGFADASSSGGATAINGGGAGAGGSDDGSGGGNGAYGADANGDYIESVANRTEDWTTGYNAGVGNGGQTSSTIQLPVNLCGNAISVFGFSSASCGGGAWAVKGESATTEDWTTGNNAGVGNGNQTTSVLQAPINVCGNAIAVFGFADASCDGGAGAVNGGGSGAGNGDDDSDDDGSGAGNGGYGDDGSGSSNGGYGNSNGTANPAAYANANGDASATGTSAHANAHMAHKAHKAKKVKNSKVDEHGRGHGAGMGAANANGYGNGNGLGDDDGNGAGNGDDSGSGGANAVSGSCSDWTTGYNAGLLNGNQIDTTLQVPVNISGNAISLFGFSQASSQGGAMAHSC